MKNVLTGLVSLAVIILICCLMLGNGFLAITSITNIVKLVPKSFWVWSAVCVFMCLVVFLFYKMFRMFPDMYSDDEEKDKGGMYK